MAKAPQVVGAGATFDAPAPLTPGQQQTAAQLAAAGATKLPAAERPGSDTAGLPADAVSMDLRGTVRVGPYQPADAEYGKRLETRDVAAIDHETNEIEAEGLAEAAAAAPKPDPNVKPLYARVGGTAWAAAKDLGGGIVQSPIAVVEGAKEALNNTLDLIDEAGDALDRIVPGTVWVGPDGVEMITQDEASRRKGNDGGFLGRFSLKGKDALTTNTGKFIEKATQFATGFVMGGKVLKGWGAAGKVSGTMKAMAQGAIADFSAFDPHEERLSNLLQDMAPEAAKPIFDYLAADNEDSELVGRTKNAIEGLGLGVVADQFFHGLRALKAARNAKAVARAEAQSGGYQVDPAMAEARAEAEGAQVVAEAEAMLKPDFKRKIDAAAKTAAPVTPAQVLNATIEPNVFDLKFHTFETADDIKAAISTIAERNVDQVDAARGGTQSWATTREAAEGIDWVSSMAARRPGEALNAAHITAYRGAMNASAQKLLTLAEEVSVNPSMAAQFAFRRHMATHNAIQMEFMGARAEAGRALNAFKMPVGTPARQLRQIDDLLAENGGAATAQELAKKVLRAARNGDVAMNEIARVGAFAHSRAMVKLLYTNGLLSGLGTPVINVAGNGFALLMNVADRAASPHVARAMGELPHVEAGEGAALLAGYWGALKDAFRMAPGEAVSHMGWQAMKEKGALRSLAPGLDDALPAGLERTGREESGGVSFADQVASKPLSAAAWRVSEDSGLGRTLDFFQMVIETPSNANALMDDFFRVAAARGELQAQAFRQTQQELRAGAIGRDGVRERMAAILASPEPHMLDAAELEMRELTFTRADGGAEKWFSSLREGLDSRGPIPFGTLLMPFVRTPANIMSMAMRHAPLAPWMARYTKDIAAGGARAELARSKWAVGTAAYALFIDMAMNGQITGGGPGNKGQRDAMSREDENGGVSWQPYSVRVGDRWINYERADPLGTAMSLAADYSEILANDDWDSGSIQTPGEVGAHIVGAFGHAFFDKTMLRSVFDTMGAVTSGNVAEAEKMLKDRATGMIPFSSALRMVRRGDDEYMRETSGVLDGLRNMTPGLSTTLPPQRDLWGRERTYQSGLGMVYDAISPVKTKAAGGSAIDIEILDLGVSVVMPTKSMQIDGERVSLRNRLDIYSTFVAAAGQPAYDHLEAVVTGNHTDSDFYFGLTDGPSGGKADYIKDVIEDYRKLAREQVMEIYGDELQTMAEQARRAREQARD